MFNVYKITAEVGYAGIALVAAENVKEANEFIQKIIDRDKDNRCDSLGYSFVVEDDVHPVIKSEIKGVILNEIFSLG